MSYASESTFAGTAAPAGTACAGGPLFAPAPLRPEDFAEVRRRLVLEHCKWDPQVGDVATLADFPLLIGPEVWVQLAHWAEQLAAESLSAEAELLQRPELHRKLDIPRPIRQVLSKYRRLGPTRTAARVLRFDFHWTREGWRISEVNSDVPGGFTEASSFTAMLAEHYPCAVPAGDPGAAWADAVARAAGPGGVVVMLSAAGYMEDLQVVAYLSNQVRARGCTAHLAGPGQLRWVDGHAWMEAAWHRGRADAIVRFYQGEWLARLGGRTSWSSFFVGGQTPMTNPGAALLIESKRFPLVWDELVTPLPTWRELLPETLEPAQSPWPRDEGWLAKSALSNNGDSIALRGITEEKEFRKTLREVRRHPGQWVAQRRFETRPVETPAGELYPCLGVFTIDGAAAGIYGRLARKQIIDYSAVDVAVLVTRSRRAGGHADPRSDL